MTKDGKLHSISTTATPVPIQSDDFSLSYALQVEDDLSIFCSLLYFSLCSVLHVLSSYFSLPVNLITLGISLLLAFPLQRSTTPYILLCFLWHMCLQTGNESLLPGAVLDIVFTFCHSVSILVLLILALLSSKPIAFIVTLETVIFNCVAGGFAWTMLMSFISPVFLVVDLAVLPALSCLCYSSHFFLRYAVADRLAFL